MGAAFGPLCPQASQCVCPTHKLAIAPNLVFPFKSRIDLYFAKPEALKRLSPRSTHPTPVSQWKLPEHAATLHPALNAADSAHIIE